MNGLSLRTKSRKAQTLARLALAAACLAAYVLTTMLFALGNPFEFWGVAQMRAFLPMAILFGILAYEMRWDGIARRLEDEVEEKVQGEGQGEGEGRKTEIGQRSKVKGQTKDDNVHCLTSNLEPLTSTLQPPPPPQPQPPPSLSTSLSPSEAWEAARAMPHSFVPDPVRERDYYALIVHAANGGHLEALLKLSEYAQKRGANVEAYFWAAVAQKRGAKGLDGRLGEIRKNWIFNEADGEYENVYEFFPETSGTIARSLLRIACSIDAPYARQRLRELASFGDANAKLFC